eukprot:2641618-Pleurochrysis_carterae.AAC.1
MITIPVTALPTEHEKHLATQQADSQEHEACVCPLYSCHVFGLSESDHCAIAASINASDTGVQQVELLVD